MSQLTKSEKLKKWRAENKEKVAAYKKKYNEENKLKIQASWKDYYERNKDYLLEKKKNNPSETKEEKSARFKKWYEKNKESQVARSAEYREKNREKTRDYSRRYAKENPESRRLNEAKRRAQKYATCTGSVTKEAINLLLQKQKNSCACCKLKFSERNFEIDHVHPLAKGGAHDISNIQLLCPRCNRAKSDKDPIRFMNEIGMLL